MKMMKFRVAATASIVMNIDRVQECSFESFNQTLIEWRLSHEGCPDAAVIVKFAREGDQSATFKKGW